MSQDNVRHLLELVKTLTSFVGETREASLLWNGLGGADGRIRQACEEALRCEPPADPGNELHRCWGLMRKETFERNIGIFFGRGAADAARLVRHARAMIATAGAATALRRQDVDGFIGWWAEAVPLLAGKVNGRPPLMWEWTRRNSNDPHSLLDYPAEVVGQADWAVAGAHDWTGYWWVRAGFPRTDLPLRTMTVPVLAHALTQSYVCLLYTSPSPRD